MTCFSRRVSSKADRCHRALCRPWFNLHPERGGAGRKEEKVLLAGLAMRKRKGEEGVRERRRER